MRFTLVLDFTEMTYYGGIIPNTPFPPDPRIEEHHFDEEDRDLLNEFFVDDINQYCGTLLDDGDLDFYDKDKCILLKKWLAEKTPTLSNERLKNLYSKLLEYATKAIKLNTGVVIEL